MIRGHKGHVRRLLAGTLLAALAVHLALVARVPGARMADWLGQAGDDLLPNRMLHLPIAGVPDAGDDSQLPGLLTSYCLLDLSGGPVEVRAPMPSGFWSADVMDDSGKVFYTTADDRWGARPLRLLVDVAGRPPVQVPASAATVSAPDSRAVLLIRMAVPRAAALPGIDGLRRQAQCTAFKP